MQLLMHAAVLRLDLTQPLLFCFPLKPPDTSSPSQTPDQAEKVDSDLFLVNCCRLCSNYCSPLCISRYRFLLIFDFQSLTSSISAPPLQAKHIMLVPTVRNSLLGQTLMDRSG